MKLITRTATLLAVMMLAACGGGSGTATSDTATTDCNPDNPATHDKCGTVYLAMTDADGDFLNYTVDITSLTLETANGRVVETLPRRTRINFTDYVALSELLAARAVPPATYVAGTITLDYSSAEVFVEANGEAKAALVQDASGNALGQTTLRIRLSDRDQLRVNRGRVALLQLDFDLEASHAVDITPTPAIATAEPYIIAEVSPVDEKDIRVRGPLATVNVDDMNYVAAIRPFHDRDGDFGRARVYVTGDTEFEVNGDMYVGAAGLRALDAAGQGTPTIAGGTLRVADREFIAHTVLAGSSVPGFDKDAVVGNVIARDGNFLTIRGATLIPRDRRAHFHDDVVVEVGPDTKVYRDGYRFSDLSIDALSVGQRVTVRGAQPTATTDATAPQVLFDATAGAVRMHVTSVSGIVNAVMPGQTDITLQSIDRRRASIFDFSGTGTAPEQDADPENYEIATGNLVLAALAEGKPIVAKGFPTAFGMAPPDFSGRTIVDYADVRSTLGVGWGVDGTIAPFLSSDTSGLLLSNWNEDIGVRHYIKQGPVLIDLQTLDSDTFIKPRETGRMLFSIKSGDSVRLYSNYEDFATDLNASLDGATSARSMHAKGKFDADSNQFAAYKIGIFLIEP
jgi:hypothetical protein